jgi:arsenate reductase
MNIQIYGNTKCFDTKKAQRYFKERGIKFQFIDILRYPMSRGEYKSVRDAVGMAALIDEKSKDYERLFIKYLDGEAAIEEKLLENAGLFKTPVVRNGRKASVGYCPEIWQTWE